MTIIATPPTATITVGNPIIRDYVNADPYDGEYTVTPLANNTVVLPTTNKMLFDDVTVNKVPYFETSNLSGTTVYIASEV